MVQPTLTSTLYPHQAQRRALLQHMRRRALQLCRRDGMCGWDCGGDQVGIAHGVLFSDDAGSGKTLTFLPYALFDCRRTLLVCDRTVATATMQQIRDHFRNAVQYVADFTNVCAPVLHDRVRLIIVTYDLLLRNYQGVRQFVTETRRDGSVRHPVIDPAWVRPPATLAQACLRKISAVRVAQGGGTVQNACRAVARDVRLAVRRAMPAAVEAHNRIESLIKTDLVPDTTTRLFYGECFDTLVADEAHYMRNDCEATEAIGRVCARVRVFMTATPINNSDEDLVPLLTVMRVPALHVLNRLIERRRHDVMRRVLRLYVSRYFLRHTNDVLPRDTSIRQTTIMLDFVVPGERQAYDSVATRRPGAKRVVSANDQERAYVKARRACVWRGFVGNDPACPRDSTKIRALDRFIREANGEKVLVFSEWTQVLEVCMQVERSVGVRCACLTGGMDSAVRTAVIRDWLESRVQVLFVSLRAFGCGWNGAQRVCSRIVFLTPSDNPQIEWQARFRILRPGQVHSVCESVTLIVRNTIEEDVLQRGRTKDEISEYYIGRNVRTEPDRVLHWTRAADLPPVRPSSTGVSGHAPHGRGAARVRGGERRSESTNPPLNSRGTAMRVCNARLMRRVMELSKPVRAARPRFADSLVNAGCDSDSAGDTDNDSE